MRKKKSTQKIRQPVPMMAQHHINSFFVIIAHSAPYKTSSSPLLAFFCYVKFIIIVSLCSALAYIFWSNSLWLKSKKFFDGRWWNHSINSCADKMWKEKINEYINWSLLRRVSIQHHIDLWPSGHSQMTITSRPETNRSMQNSNTLGYDVCMHCYHWKLKTNIYIKNMSVQYNRVCLRTHRPFPGIPHDPWHVSFFFSPLGNFDFCFLL